MRENSQPRQYHRPTWLVVAASIAGGILIVIGLIATFTH